MLEAKKDSNTETWLNQAVKKYLNSIFAFCLWYGPVYMTTSICLVLVEWDDAWKWKITNKTFPFKILSYNYSVHNSLSTPKYVFLFSAMVMHISDSHPFCILKCCVSFIVWLAQKWIKQLLFIKLKVMGWEYGSVSGVLAWCTWNPGLICCTRQSRKGDTWRNHNTQEAESGRLEIQGPLWPI